VRSGLARGVRGGFGREEGEGEIEVEVEVRHVNLGDWWLEGVSTPGRYFILS
jgi:hypothetical protein